MGRPVSSRSVTPRIELHLHLEGSIRPATLLEIAGRNGEALPADTVEGLTRLYEFTDFRHFIEVWVLTTNCLRTAEDFRRVVVDYAAEAASFGAVYVEGIFSPCERVQRGVGWQEIFEGYTDGAIAAAEEHGVTVRFTPDLYRGVPVELAEECARMAVRYRERGVVGLGLGGIEGARPVSEYAKAFAIARDGGLAAVPHAGEAEDAALLAEIVDRGLVLDVCPTSNLRTGMVSTLDSHPLPALRAAGIPCTINTDDPAMFGTDLGREYEIAASLGVSAEEAYAAGLAGALCDEPTRARLGALI